MGSRLAEFTKPDPVCADWRVFLVALIVYAWVNLDGWEHFARDTPLLETVLSNLHLGIQGPRPTFRLLEPLKAGAFLEGNAMTDNTKQTGQDRKLISLEQDYEVRDWMKSFGCTEEELRAAVKAVGNSADEVREYLAKKK